MAYVYDATLVLDTSQYASGDVLSVAAEFKGVFKPAGEARKLVSIVGVDEDAQGQAFDLVFSNAAITLGTINSAVSISDADARLIIGMVSIVSGDITSHVNSSRIAKNNINQILQPVYASQSLWISAICRGGTPTYTASGIKLKLGFE